MEFMLGFLTGVIVGVVGLCVLAIVLKNKM